MADERARGRRTRRVLAGFLVLATFGSACATESPRLEGAGFTDVSRAPAGDIAHLSAVSLTPRDGYDELVLEFTDRVPGYTVGYVPLPARADGSGAEIALPGAGDVVAVTLTPATADGWAGGRRSYFGPAELSAPGTSAVTEAKAAGDFEAVLTWVAGVRARVPFRVEALEAPPRLVVEFQSPP